MMTNDLGKKLINDDLSVNWHPFMQMKDFETYPPKLIRKANGIKLYSDNEWYYDTISSWWCNLFGHNHPSINQAIKNQLDSLDHIMFGNFTHEPAINLSKKLIELTPNGLDRVYYSDNGSTAIEVSLKMSLHYWELEQKNKANIAKKNKFVCFEGSYHGDTIGAMSVSGVNQYNHIFKSVMFESMIMPDPSISEDNALEQLEQTLKNHHHQIAAVICEPMLMGAGGMKVVSERVYQQARLLTQQYNVHLISDEVATGFGRSGAMFVSDIAQVSPDFMCLSKGLTNGQFPLAVTLTTDQVFQQFYDDFEKGKTFYHGHTYTANPIGCAIANAALDLLKTTPWQANVKQLNQTLTTAFNKLSDELPMISNPRCFGTVAAMDIQTDEPRGLFKLSQKGFDHGLTIRPLGNTLYLFLPIITTTDELDDILKRLKKIIQSVPLTY